MLTVQEFPSALSVPTTLAARPLSARSLLRALRLALRDGGGRAGTGSGTPSITLALAPASRCAISSFSTASVCSSCSSVISLIALLCSALCSRGTSRVRHRKYTPGCSRRTDADLTISVRKTDSIAHKTASLSELTEVVDRWHSITVR